MANRVFLDLPNPNGQDTVAYTSIVLQRAPDVAGVPGAFATIATLAIDTSNEDTSYIDAAGSLTSWYMMWYTNGVTTSDPSAAWQQGDYLIRRWIKNDIPDTDITNALWDQWRDQVIIDLNYEGVSRYAATQIYTPGTSQSEWVNLNAEIRTVTSVELYSSTDFVTAYGAWEQKDRRLRIKYPNTALNYYIYGVAEIRNLSDLDDELFMLLYWGIRKRYLDKRLSERMNFRKTAASSQTKTDLSPGMLLGMKKDADNEYQNRLEKARKFTTTLWDAI